MLNVHYMTRSKTYYVSWVVIVYIFIANLYCKHEYNVLRLKHKN